MSLTNDKSKSVLSQWKNLQKVSVDTNQITSTKERTVKKEHLPSTSQQRLFFLEQLFPDNPIYNLTEIWNFKGALDNTLFLNALTAVSKRQNTLRTTFHIDDDHIKCKINKDCNYDSEIIDFSHLEEEALVIELETITRKKARKSFDLSAGPLLSITICKLDNYSFQIIINVHHIISDKWSMRILREEISTIYKLLKSNKEVDIPPLSKQYYDFAEEETKSKIDPTHISYWKSKLDSSAQNVTLPYDKDSHKNETLSGKYSTKSLPINLFKQIKSFCKDHKMTSFNFFLSVFKILIYKYTGESDIVVGTPISTRSKTEYEKIIGFFNDTIALRSLIEKETTFLDFLSITRNTVLEAFQHKDIGFQNIINEINPNRSVSINPLFQLMFLYHQEYNESDFTEDISIKVNNFDMGVSKFDLTLYVSESIDNFELTVEYATDLYTESYVQRIHEHIAVLSKQILSAPNTPIQKLTCLSEKEIDELFRIGTGPYLTIEEDHLIASIFKKDIGHQIALTDETKSITYDELDSQSNQIANQLSLVNQGSVNQGSVNQGSIIQGSLKQGATNQNPSIVAILMDQSVDFVVAMIGILKAGLCYLPLDNSYPTTHIHRVLQEADVKLIICNDPNIIKEYGGYEFLNLNVIKASEEFVLQEIDKNAAAYVIFTSGSTGKPNGVVISHSNLLNSTKARFDFYEDQPSSFLLLSSFSFDSSVAGIFWTLMNGGKLVIPKLQSVQDVDIISTLISKEKVSHTLLIPSLYAVYLEHIPVEILETLKVVTLAGEVLTTSTAEKHLTHAPTIRLYNEYGPTESTVWACAHEVKSPLLDSKIPIGKPIANTTLVTLDKDQNLTPRGIPGELHILGPSVSSGYLKTNNSRKGKFVTTEFYGKKQSLYKTGDWVKWDENNNLLFIGRNDHQVKIRGHRIELGEIDSAINFYNKDLQAATIFIKDRNTLISYVQSKDPIEEKSLLKYLGDKLPKHFCPDKIIRIENFPLMPNGKLDINSLKELAQSTKSVSQKIDNQTDLESKILDIWKEVLQNKDLTIHDNFFESGGDSIQIIRVISKLRKDGLALSPKDIYEHQNISSLTSILEQEQSQESQIFIWDKLPLSPIQEWFFSTHLHNPNHWNQGYTFELNTPRSTDKVQNAISQIIDHHSIFNVCFIKEHDKWFCKRKIYKKEAFISVKNNDEKEPIEIDISRGPLARFTLIEKDGMVASGSIIMHHLITDALSWNLLFSDLEDKIAGEQFQNNAESFDYFKWIYNLKLLSTTSIYDDTLPYWNRALEQKSSFFSKHKISREKNVVTINKTISKDTTQSIKYKTRQFSNLKIDEIIITCFLQVYYNNTKENNLTVMLERHGRDNDSKEINLSNSIGWHTTYFPVHFQLSNSDSTIESLLNIKEQVRSVPNNGQSYGVLRYLSNKINKKSNAKVVINYLGEHLTNSSKTFRSLNFIREGMRDINSEREYVIEINAWIEDDSLEIAFSYDQLQLDPKEMESWCDEIYKTISIIARDLENAPPVKTPSDFDFRFTQDDIQTISTSKINSNTKIADLIELTATQSALLFHHLHNTKNDQGLIIAKANLNGEINTDNLQKAWNMLIEKHEVLRSYFMWDGISKPAQVICENVEFEIDFNDNQSNQNSDFKQQIESWINNQSYHGLTLDTPSIYKLGCFKLSNNLHRLVFICHHIYLDGWSTSNLFNEFIEIYTSLEKNQIPKLDSVPSLSKWKNYFDDMRDDPYTTQFWQSYLENAKPSFLKKNYTTTSNEFDSITIELNEQTSRSLSSDIKKSRITLNILFIGIWSWLLSNYLDQEEATIGITYSGRSLPLNQIDRLIGMFSSVLPIKIKSGRNNEIDFNYIQSQFNDILVKDAVSLDDLTINTSQLQTELFDTLLIVENFAAPNNDSNKVYLSDFGSQISSMIPFCLIVIPGNKIKLTLRYNTQTYRTEEVQSISSDIHQILSSIRITDGKSNIDSVPEYKIKDTIKDTPSDPKFTQAPEIRIEQNDSLDFQEKLLNIWKEILNNDKITIKDNFFEIGGTSLLAVRIFNRINEESSINASPILLLKNNSVQSLSKVLLSNQAQESWQCLYPLNETGSRPPLFCFHAGDGHIMFFKDLANAIGPDRSVYGIQPVGLDGSEIQFSTIVEMANFYIREIKKKYPTGPYHLMGTCFSNSVTFEIAKQLKSEIGSIIIVDSPPPYFKELSKLKKWLSWIVTLNFSKLAQAFNNYFKYSKLREPTDIQEKNLFNTAKHLRHILSQYQWSPQDIDITLIRSSENNDDLYKNYHILNWKLLAKGGLQFKTVPGKHLEIFDGESARIMAEITNLILSHHES